MRSQFRVFGGEYVSSLRMQEWIKVKKLFYGTVAGLLCAGGVLICRRSSTLRNIQTRMWSGSADCGAF